MATQVTSTNGTGQALAFSEAPASINTFVTSPAGFSYQLTMRAGRVGDLLAQARTLEAWLVENGWTPASKAQGKAQAQAVPGDAGQGEAPTCPTHGRPMKPGKNGGWYCPAKLLEDDGTGKPVYCKQRR